MFNLQVTKNKITATETEILVAGSSKVYEVYFEFDSDWADLQEKICFTIDAELSTTPLPLFYLRLDESGKCYIPKWILDDTFIGKDLLCGACGTRGNETILPTVWISLGEI